MWNDEIVEETRQARDRYAAKFGYDLDAIYRDLKKQEEASTLICLKNEPLRPH